MPDILHSLDQQIAHLQQKRDALQKKAAEALFQKLQTICGGDFSAALILGIVSSSLKQASSGQKEAWAEAGQSFLKLPRRKSKTTGNTS